MLDEMRAVAPRIADYTDFTREFLALADQALTNDQCLKGAFYLRAAEFFMLSTDPTKRPTRERFLQLVKMHYGVRSAATGSAHHHPSSQLSPTPPSAIIDR